MHRKSLEPLLHSILSMQGADVVKIFGFLSHRFIKLSFVLSNMLINLCNLNLRTGNLTGKFKALRQGH